MRRLGGAVSGRPGRHQPSGRRSVDRARRRRRHHPAAPAQGDAGRGRAGGVRSQRMGGSRGRAAAQSAVEPAPEPPATRRRRCAAAVVARGHAARSGARWHGDAARPGGASAARHVVRPVWPPPGSAPARRRRAALQPAQPGAVPLAAGRVHGAGRAAGAVAVAHRHRCGDAAGRPRGPILRPSPRPAGVAVQHPSVRSRRPAAGGLGHRRHAGPDAARAAHQRRAGRAAGQLRGDIAVRPGRSDQPRARRGRPGAAPAAGAVRRRARGSMALSRRQPVRVGGSARAAAARVRGRHRSAHRPAGDWHRRPRRGRRSSRPASRRLHLRRGRTDRRASGRPR